MSAPETVGEERHAAPSVQVLASPTSLYLGVSGCAWQETRKGLAHGRGKGG